MYFKCHLRKNKDSDQFEPYFRLVESYRNFDDRICHRTMLNIGFMPMLSKPQFVDIQTRLTNLANCKANIFESPDPIVNQYVSKFFKEMLKLKKLDISTGNTKILVDVDSIKHSQVREIGAEWLCYQALEQLGLSTFLAGLGWDTAQVQLTLTQIISRAVYPVSELQTTRLIHDNSAICEITKYPNALITKDKLYKNALSLYGSKDAIEQYLSKKTNELFDLEDKIVLYDLTNTYFEGEKRKSKLANFGRSKEKRTDAKLIVLALVINQEGFLKYSQLFEGNTTDSTTLPKIINNLRLKTTEGGLKATVVLDAGIATDENLKLLDELGYKYVCVSRSKLKEYQAVKDSQPQTVKTCNGQTLQLQRVGNKKATDYYLKVSSPGKLLKEKGMKTQFETRFEAQLEKIAQSLGKKHGVKTTQKVNQRIGRALQKYPSVSKYYDIEVTEKETGTVQSLTWAKGEREAKEELGVYFLRTNMAIEQEANLWKTYNIIREIESTFRSLKTDLDLRPIYHKNDDATMAHLHLGLLAHWVVNTIRYQLKAKGINHDWTEIKRIASTQKLVTTQAKDQKDEPVEITKCSEPSLALKNLFELLKYKNYPFTKRKSVVHKMEIKKNEKQQNHLIMDD